MNKEKQITPKPYVIEEEDFSSSILCEPVVDYSCPLFEDEDTDEIKEIRRQKEQNTQANLDTEPWQDKSFSHPERTIRLAT